MLRFVRAAVLPAASRQGGVGGFRIGPSRSRLGLYAASREAAPPGAAPLSGGGGGGWAWACGEVLCVYEGTTLPPRLALRQLRRRTTRTLCG